MNLQNLSPEQYQAAQAWKGLFTNDGWSLLMQRFEDRIESTVSDMESAESLLDLGMAKGKRIVLLELTDLVRIVSEEFQELAAQGAEPQEVIETHWRG